MECCPEFVWQFTSGSKIYPEFYHAIVYMAYEGHLIRMINAFCEICEINSYMPKNQCQSGPILSKLGPCCLSTHNNTQQVLQRTTVRSTTPKSGHAYNI